MNIADRNVREWLAEEERIRGLCEQHKKDILDEATMKQNDIHKLAEEHIESVYKKSFEDFLIAYVDNPNATREKYRELMENNVS